MPDPSPSTAPNRKADDAEGGPVAVQNLDLSNCDREQVHLVGAIQPHGALLVLKEPELRVVQASSNTLTFLGVPSETLVGQAIDCLLDEEGSRALRAKLAGTNLTGVLAHLLTVPCLPHRDTHLHVFGNRIDGFLLLEFERVGEPVQSLERDRLADLRDTLQRLRDAGSLGQFLDVVVERFRAMTGFDRVLAYRFDADGSGEVVAEVRPPGLASYLGLHYPASDIPVPARRLFSLSPLRHLPDVDYAAVPLVPDVPLVDGVRGVDLSYSLLRSVSAMYSGYLRNMGVKAALVAPLLKDGKLWGLISCMHHSGALYLPFERRIPVEFLAQMVSLLMGGRAELDHYAYRAQLDQVLGHFVGALGRSEGLHEALAAGDPNLLSAIDASGAALIDDGRLTLLGQTPSRNQVGVLADWLVQQEPAVFYTHRLAHDFPVAQEYSAVAGGLLTIRLSRATADRVIWFRVEAAREVHWAGDPNKPVEMGEEDPAQRLRPRTSFALWKEAVRGQSRPWLDCELDYASRLRQAISDVIVERARRLTRVNAELERSNLELDSFAYAASHDLKEPLRGIHNFAEFLKTEEATQLSDRGRQRLATILRLADRMDDLLESLLQYSRVFRNELDLDSQPIGALVERTVDFLQQSIPGEGIAIEIQAFLPVVRCDRMRAEMIFHNLIMNAIKYNNQPAKTVFIGCDTTVDPPVFFVRDNGIGIAPSHQEVVFQLFRRLHARDEYGGGAGAGLTIAQKAVKRHGGRIWVESVVGEGSTFYFTLAPERDRARDVR